MASLSFFFLLLEESGVTLLQLIGDPPPNEISQEPGPDNSPGYVFGQNANAGQLARAHLSNPFYRDFALIFHLKATSKSAGVVFSIMDSSQQIMYVGVKLSEEHGRNQYVILYYTEPDSEESYEAARFLVPSMVERWTRFSIAVRDDKVMFYLNCDTEPQVMRIERSPDEMNLDPAAGVFVGQAGGADPQKFQVCLQACPGNSILAQLCNVLHLLPKLFILGRLMFSRCLYPKSNFSYLEPNVEWNQDINNDGEKKSFSYSWSLM